LLFTALEAIFQMNLGYFFINHYAWIKIVSE